MLEAMTICKQKIIKIGKNLLCIREAAKKLFFNGPATKALTKAPRANGYKFLGIFLSFKK